MLACYSFATLGLVVFLATSVRILCSVYIYTKPSSIKKYLRPGAWALVTGATDGIGLALVRELASHGFNVVLHGRNPEKLEKVEKGLREDYPGRDFTSVIADAAESHGMKKSITGIVSSLDRLTGPLTILINNAGGVSPQEEKYLNFKDLPPDQLDGLLNLNARFAAKLTQPLIPKLARDGPSCIMNISSVAASIGIPYFAIYSGTKAFLEKWSLALSREMWKTSTNIEVLCIVVGEVTDVSHNQNTATFWTPPSRDFARSVLNRIGCGRVVVAGYWPHAVQNWCSERVPHFVTSMVISNVIENRKARDQKLK